MSEEPVADDVPVTTRLIDAVPAVPVVPPKLLCTRSVSLPQMMPLPDPALLRRPLEAPVLRAAEIMSVAPVAPANLEFTPMTRNLRRLIDVPIARGMMADPTPPTTPAIMPLAAPDVKLDVMPTHVSMATTDASRSATDVASRDVGPSLTATADASRPTVAGTPITLPGRVVWMADPAPTPGPSPEPPPGPAAVVTMPGSKTWRSCCVEIDPRSALFFSQLGITAVIMGLCIYELVVHGDNADIRATYGAFLMFVVGVYLPTPMK